MDQVKIGRFIAQLRKEKGMTQTALAEKLSVTDKAVSKWENGRCMPDVSCLRPLTEELGITINELLAGERIPQEDYTEKSGENVFELVGKVLARERRPIRILLCLLIASTTATAVLLNTEPHLGIIAFTVTLLLGYGWCGVCEARGIPTLIAFAVNISRSSPPRQPPQFC